VALEATLTRQIESLKAGRLAASLCPVDVAMTVDVAFPGNAERAADQAAAKEREATLHEEIAELRGRLEKVIVPQLNHHMENERRSHVADALSKLRELETAGSMRVASPSVSRYSPTQPFDLASVGAGGGATGVAAGVAFTKRLTPNRFGSTRSMHVGASKGAATSRLAATGLSRSFSSRGPGLTSSFLGVASPRR